MFTAFNSFAEQLDVLRENVRGWQPSTGSESTGVEPSSHDPCDLEPDLGRDLETLKILCKY